jgi:hypothetical protein
MIWFLRLFPQYRELEAAARAAAELSTRLQDQNHVLTEQNMRLVEEAQESRAAQITALQSIANIRMQIEFGGMPPYPNAYSVPKQAEVETGPIPTDRVQGRDLVRAGMDDFHASIRNLSKRN